MADQSVGTGKFAGLLLLLQGLLIILFVVFVGYSDDLLTGLPEQAEHGIKIESNYSGKRYRLPSLLKVQYFQLPSRLCLIVLLTKERFVTCIQNNQALLN